MQFKPFHFSGKLFLIVFSILPFYTLKRLFTEYIAYFFFNNGITLIELKSKVKLKLILSDHLTIELLWKGKYEEKSVDLAKRILGSVPNVRLVKK